MSKRHQSSRRRSYGRRQHELHERFDRQVVAAIADLDDEPGRPERFDLGRASQRQAPLSFAVAD